MTLQQALNKGYYLSTYSDHKRPCTFIKKADGKIYEERILLPVVDNEVIPNKPNPQKNLKFELHHRFQLNEKELVWEKHYYWYAIDISPTDPIELAKCQAHNQASDNYWEQRMKNVKGWV